MVESKADIVNHNYSKSDKRVSTVFVIHIYLLICKNMLVNVNDTLFSYNNFLNKTIMFLFLGLYLWLFLTSGIIRKIKPITWEILILIILFWVTTYCIDSVRFISNDFPYSYVKRQLRTFLAYCLPLFVIVSTVSSFDCLLRKLFRYVSIPFIVATFSFYLSLKPHTNGVYMSYGNAVLVASIIILFKFIYTKSAINLLQFLLTCVYIIISGSRGPLVSIFLAVICAFIICRKKRYIIIIGVIGILVFIFREVVLQIISNLMDTLNIKSRTIEMLLSGKIGSDSDRSLIHQNLLNRLNNYPLTGLGAFGGEATVGLSHSVYLDIWANFGYVIGTIFMVYMAISNLYYHIRYRHSSFSVLLLIISLILLPRGFFDENFWGAKELWIMMAMHIQIHYGKPLGCFQYNYFFKNKKGKNK